MYPSMFWYMYRTEDTPFQKSMYVTAYNTRTYHEIKTYGFKGYYNVHKKVLEPRANVTATVHTVTYTYTVCQ